MPRRDLHKKPYDEGTLDKLELFRQYLREWLPVFIHAGYINSIQVFDFFAGPGMDLDGNAGSPVITCEEIQAAQLLSTGAHPQIKIYFNEYDKDKYNRLFQISEQYKNILPEVRFSFSNMDFAKAFTVWQPLMLSTTANLLFLDQSGVQQITKPVFQSIVQLPHTDFIFFISSAMINRFKNIREIRKYLPVTDEDVAIMNGTKVHRILTNAYRRWLPAGLKYYLASFSLKKGANVYGLVFGSRHPRGIDKFLRVAWKRGGDANFDIDNDGIDPSQPSLFRDQNTPTKIIEFEKNLQCAILKRELLTNKDIFIFTLQDGVLSCHAREALKQMMKNGIIPKQKINVSYGAWENPTEQIIRVEE